jgi:hypothetical protein
MFPVSGIRKQMQLQGKKTITDACGRGCSGRNSHGVCLFLKQRNSYDEAFSFIRGPP